MNTENDSQLWDVFKALESHYQKLLERLVPDSDEAVQDAARAYSEMIPEMAYAQNQTHPMAGPVFVCTVVLAFFLSARSRGIDAHTFGRAMLLAMDPSAAPPSDKRSPKEIYAELKDHAGESQKHAKPGEFVFEVVLGDGKEFDWGSNIRSCAICSAYSKHDAMDLVPYMCATDDVTSDWGEEGLLRTGTMALGSHQCDFRYKQGRKGQHLAKLYPDRIRLTERT